jgi:hypothetical protein
MKRSADRDENNVAETTPRCQGPPQGTGVPVMLLTRCGQPALISIACILQNDTTKIVGQHGSCGVGGSFGERVSVFRL